MNTRPLRIAALLALLVLPITALAWDLDCRYGAERKASIDTAGAARVEIMARAGDLTVRPGSGTTLAAEGRACASSQAFLDQTQLHVRRQGDVVQVHVQVPEEMKGIGLMYASLDLTVSVPGDLPVEVTDSSGDMTLESVPRHEGAGQLGRHRGARAQGRRRDRRQFGRHPRSRTRPAP